MENLKISSKFSQRGAIYLWVLIALFFLTLGLGQWAVNYATLQQREKEQELIMIGLKYRSALIQYHEASPGGMKTYPEKLEDLLKDPRSLETRRYLRKLEKDPLTSLDFQVLKNQNGEIIGIYSDSTRKPIKRVKFPNVIQHFNRADSYRDWIFYAN